MWGRVSGVFIPGHLTSGAKLLQVEVFRDSLTEAGRWAVWWAEEMDAGWPTGTWARHLEEEEVARARAGRQVDS